jgi:hypothetical protein
LRKIPVTRRYVIEFLRKHGIKVSLRHPENFISYDELQDLCAKYEIAHKVFGRLLDFYFERVFSIRKYVKPKKLIDIETGYGNFVANGYLVHNSTYRIWLRRGREGTRVARIFDSPYHPELETSFKITEKGVEDLSPDG